MGKRLLFGIEAGGLLALSAVPGVLYYLWVEKSLDLARVIIGMTPATLTAFLFAALITLMPDLAADCRIRRPMNLAFPIAFAGLNLVVARSIWFSPSIVEAPHSILNPILVWFRPQVILAALAFQIIVLSLAARSPLSEPSRAESSPEAGGS